MGRELRLEGRLPLVQLVPVEKTERDGTMDTKGRLYRYVYT